MSKLITGKVYNSVAYGPVMYVGTTRNEAGLHYRFNTSYGKRKYIGLKELEFFLEEGVEAWA